MSSRISVLPDSDSRFRIDADTNFNKVCAHFSLARIEKGKYCFSKLSRSEKAEFAESLFQRRKMSWEEIAKINHKTLGSEKLPMGKFKPNPPSCVTPERRYLTIFRFGENGRMVGYRVRYVFYILWIDCKYKLYKH